MKNKILAGLLSLAIAAGLWMYVVTYVTTDYDETFYNIPVVLQGEAALEERGLMITSDKKPMVDLKLAGNRADMLNLNSSNITLTADVSKIYEPGVHALTYTPSYPGNVPNNAISVQNRDPERVLVTVEERGSKTVDVAVEYTGTLPDGLIYDKENVILDYPVINITGPKAVVDRITQAKIQVSLDSRTETIVEQYEYTLCDKDGEPVDAAFVTTDVETVNLTLKIQRVKEVALKLKVLAGGGATEQTSDIQIDPATIRVSGSEMLLEGFDELEIGTVNLGDLAKDSTLTFPINLPEGITNETGLTEVTVEVKFPNLRTKTLNVTKIQAINVPAGLEVDLITQMLEIKIRGPVDMIADLDEEDITIRVDFTDAKLGTATMKAEITIASQFTDVGAVGTYSVSATLHDPEEA